MRIKKLTMQAFGPFKDCSQIDFDPLNEKGIFLLSGPTGVGKTSIFDAICFALYGELSGSNGDISKVRSSFADLNTLTFVELSFEIGNVDYFIRREPTQIKIGRGNKEVNHSHQAFLTFDDKHYEGIKEVDGAINEILGLTLSQFRQIVLMPQGEFMHLLSASSDVRAGIFRKLFDTMSLVAFEDYLDLDSKAKKKEIEQNLLVINTRLKSLETEDSLYFDLLNKEFISYNEVFTKADFLLVNEHEEVKNLENSIALLNGEIVKSENEIKEILAVNEAFVDLEVNKKALDSLLKEEEKFNQNKRFLNLINKARIARVHENNYLSHLEDKQKLEKDLEDFNKQLSLLKESLNNVEKKAYELDLKSNEISNMRKNLVYLKVEQERIQANLLLISSLSTMEKNIEKVKGSISVLENEHKVIEEKKDKANIEILDYRAKALQYTALSLKKSEIDALQERLKPIIALHEEKEKLNSQVESSKELYEKNNIQLLDKKLELAKDEKDYFINQSASLASELKDGYPCPVCGSKTHPNKAHFVNEVTKESISNKRDLIEKKAEEVNKLYSKWQIDKANYDKNRDDFNRLFAIYPDYLSQSQNCSTKKENISKELAAISNSQDMLDSCEKNLKVIEKEVLDNKEKLDSKKAELSNMTIEKAKLEGSIISIDNDDDLKEKITTIEKTIDIYDNNLQNNKKDKEKISIDIGSINEKISFYKSSLIKKNDLVKSSYDSFTNDLQQFSPLEYRMLLDNESKEKEINEYVDRYQKDKALYIENIEKNKKRLEGKSIVDVVPHEASLALLQEKYKNLLSKKGKVQNQYERNLKIIDTVKKAYNENLSKIKVYEDRMCLANIARGKNAYKISFERYVLASYFDSVIDVANTMFLTLTNNRYELVRRKSLAKGNQQQGLDIDIFDHYNGAIRDVLTLSGGESFKAALSLALGLSSIISEKSGGTSIETLFIDEGFGSLDDASLESAIEVLVSLKNTGRVIGIISHVQELHERIPNKILLEATTLGSRIKSIVY